ncbi:MAG: hypothetical protein Phog2KO_51200 [Phototrophicaceae bacterium]
MGASWEGLTRGLTNPSEFESMLRFFFLEKKNVGPTMHLFLESGLDSLILSEAQESVWNSVYRNSR